MVPTLSGPCAGLAPPAPGPGGPSASLRASSALRASSVGVGGVLAAAAQLRPRPPPRAALRVGAWPCGAGVMLLMDAYLVNLDTTSDPTGLPSATVYGYRGLF